MGKYFGTDGFRGEAGVDLTAEHAFKIGRYLGHYLNGERLNKSQKRARVAIGKDTRLSSYMLEYAISAGFVSSGADVYLLHVTTTPSVSFITLSEGFDLGVMITASHNPFADNGIKIIDNEGKKLSDEVSRQIEDYLDAEDAHLPFAKGADIGRVYDYYAGRNRYIGRLISLASSSYKGLKIGLDVANGATFAIARSVFAALGAEIHSIYDEPNGLNVNCQCGSTHPEALARLVKERGLDVGFAFDGDGDRCIAVNELGEVVNGDCILYILAHRLKRRGELSEQKVVATVMSNGGFAESLRKEGITVESTRVGDRFVYEKMQESGATLGGEESGHIIISNISSTGDGILTSILLTEEMLDTGMHISELCRGLSIYPQYSKSIKVRDKGSVLKDSEIVNLISKLASVEGCRVLVRESGTEPKIRVMAEAKKDDICHAIVDEVISLIRQRGYADE